MEMSLPQARRRRHTTAKPESSKPKRKHQQQQNFNSSQHDAPASLLHMELLRAMQNASASPNDEYYTNWSPLRTDICYSELVIAGRGRTS
jgi:hypothetical protein